MTTPARAVFEKLYGEMGLTTNDAAWLVFLSGWNASLEKAAWNLSHNFKHSFGPDTMASVAVYVKDHRE